METTKTMIVALCVLLACINFACTPGVSPQIPEAATANAQAAPWLSQMIQELEQSKPNNPPTKIYRYTYNDKEVYYVTGRCCDIPSKLYNMNGSVICEPDGGITGKGDGRCPDFFEKRSDETLIWEDKREQK